ncbi:PaaI family thioesterase [soil metagenome]
MGVAQHRLRNEAWGFESNCFVCEPTNGVGLKLAFTHDDEAAVVRSEFSLDEAFSGAPSLVHGGVVLAVLDEAQACATIAMAGRFAVTTETTSRFVRPVRLRRTYTVEATVTGNDGRRLTTAARVLDHRARVCVDSQAVFTVMSEAVAARAIGPLNEHDAAFLED